MSATRPSCVEFFGSITQCVVGLCRLAALLFVLQITIFVALGPADSAHVALETTFPHAPSVGSGDVFRATSVGFAASIHAVDEVVEPVSRMIVLILVPLLGFLLLMSPFVPGSETRHLLLALFTLIGLLPLVVFDISFAPWAASALPHLSHTLLLGGVVPLVATISMMSVGVLLTRRRRPHAIERVISNPAARRIASHSGPVSGGPDSGIKSSRRHRRMP